MANVNSPITRHCFVYETSRTNLAQDRSGWFLGSLERTTGHCEKGESLGTDRCGPDVTYAMVKGKKRRGNGTRRVDGKSSRAPSTKPSKRRSFLCPRPKRHWLPLIFYAHRVESLVSTAGSISRWFSILGADCRSWWRSSEDLVVHYPADLCCLKEIDLKV